MLKSVPGFELPTALGFLHRRPLFSPAWSRQRDRENKDVWPSRSGTRPWVVTAVQDRADGEALERGSSLACVGGSPAWR
jgi:hypothetical protein